MKEEERIAYIKYRLQKSDETLDVAKLLIENNKWDAAINRLYYAAFYAVTALLVKHNLDSKSHSGVKSLFSLHFVKTNHIDLTLGKLYTDLFDWRHKGDYGDFFDFKEEDVKPLLQPTQNLIDAIKREIEK